MKARAALLISIFLFAVGAIAQDNRLLAEIYAADQAARRSDNIDWSIVSVEDAERRASVIEILSAGNIRTAQDYYNAAMIFQHGGSEEEIRMAHSFATIAASLGNSPARNWLMAASWDRLMLRYEQPQWYGTQYVMDESGRWVLYEVHPTAVTDEQRAAWSVPTLEEAQSRVAIMNGDR